MSAPVGAIGIEPVGDVARRMEISVRCAKRRLMRLATQIAAEHPDEPPLLHKLGGDSREGVRWYMDRAVAWRHARGFIGPGGEDPWLAVLRHTDARFEEAITLLRAVADDAAASREIAAELLAQRPRAGEAAG